MNMGERPVSKLYFDAKFSSLGYVATEISFLGRPFSHLGVLINKLTSIKIVLGSAR